MYLYQFNVTLKYIPLFVEYIYTNRMFQLQNAGFDSEICEFGESPTSTLANRDIGE